MDFRIHWFAITIWKPSKHTFALWDIWFTKYFGPVFPAGHGARMFAEVHKGLLGAKLYVKPLQGEDEYFHLEIPGKACEAIQPIELMQFIVDLSTYEKYRVTRLDLAWDGVPFTPQEFIQAVYADKARTYAKRETLHLSTEPFGLRENGEVGTSNVTLGKRQSQRSLRVYDLHGPVRLELETRKERADLITRDVLSQHPDQWPALAIGHLRDFIDVDTKAWRQFIKEKGRANAKLVNAREVELSKMTEWLLEQVSPALSVVVDVIGEDVPLALIKKGRQKRGKKYKAILEMKNKKDVNHVPNTID